MDNLKEKIEDVLGSIGEDVKDLAKKYGIYIILVLIVLYIYKKWKENN